MSNERERTKLSLVEYYERLQIEYEVNRLRSRIYPSERWRKKFEKIMGKKQKTILEISENRLQGASHIFNSTAVFNDIMKRIYNPYGYPNWHYTHMDGEQTRREDYDFYYKEGISVVCYERDKTEPIAARVVASDYDKATVTVEPILSREPKVLSCSVVKRTE